MSGTKLVSARDVFAIQRSHSAETRKKMSVAISRTKQLTGQIKNLRYAAKELRDQARECVSAAEVCDRRADNLLVESLSRIGTKAATALGATPSQIRSAKVPKSATRPIGRPRTVFHDPDKQRCMCVECMKARGQYYYQPKTSAVASA